MKISYIIPFLILQMILISCKNNSSDGLQNNINSQENDSYSEVSSEDDTYYVESEESAAAAGEYSDGTYRAEIDYYNSETGTSSTYTLDIEVENGELTTIHWPNDGWLDESHFSPPDISDGTASFESDSGYEYEVRILD